jgi:hypothetical protein
MFVRYRHPYVYTVLRSVRTPQGPRHVRVAHWYGTPSLPVAIGWLEANVAELAHFRPPPGYEASANSPKARAYRAARITELRRRLAELETARATLGDWLDPVERPEAAAVCAVPFSERMSRIAQARRARKARLAGEAERREEEEHRRRMESLTRMAY